MKIQRPRDSGLGIGLGWLGGPTILGVPGILVDSVWLVVDDLF